MRGRTRTRTPAGGRNSRARAGAGSGDANRCRRTTPADCRAGWGGPGTPPIRRAGAPPPRRPTPGAIRPVPKVPASPEPTAEEPRPVCDRERRQLAAHGPGAAPTSPASSTRSLCDGSPRAPRTPPTPRPPASIPLPPASPPDATVESAHTSICTAAWGWLLFRLLQPPPGSRWEQRFGVALRCRFRRPGVYCVRSVEPSRPVVPGRRGIASILFEVSVPPDSRRLPTPVERGPAHPAGEWIGTHCPNGPAHPEPGCHRRCRHRPSGVPRPVGLRSGSVGRRRPERTDRAHPGVCISGRMRLPFALLLSPPGT